MMAQAATFYVDATGKPWPTPEHAVKADLQMTIRGNGEPAYLAAELVDRLMAHRSAVERAFRELDAMTKTRGKARQ